MRDIKNLNIWKQEPISKVSSEAFMGADITELNLGVRSYNCLKRAGCSTIRDIFNCMGEDGQGLRKIRNLGTRSENEIIEKIKEIEEIYVKTHPAGSEPMKRTIIKPAKKIWGLANKMTSKALDAIGSIGGPRCCKRDSYMAIISAIDYVAENFNIQMEKPVIKCIHSDKNNQCIKERCPFHE